MGLGTGRRGMKSPPLLIAVLLACVFVLGINYWITSSRCVELQNRVMELEGRMRRAAAERGAVEIKKNEYEDMLGKQKKQIDTIQSLHSSQMQTVHSQCNSEKYSLFKCRIIFQPLESLLNNLTNKDNIIQSLQSLSLEESKVELEELEESQTKKLSYELAQCSSKISEVKEQCEERLRHAGVKGANVVNEENVEKTISGAEKPKPTTKQEIIEQKEEEEVKSKDNLEVEIVPPSKEDENAAIPPPANQVCGLSFRGAVTLHNPKTETVEEIVERIVREKKSKQEDKNADNVQKPENENDPDNIIAEEDKEGDDQETNKENEVEREHLVNLDGQQEDDKGQKQNEQEQNAGNPNDYNGDEANVAEPEAEKQAQLNDNSQNLKVDNPLVGLNKQAAGQEAEDSDNPTLK
ncbi:PREDICTED: Golgi membrane protein 1 [Nanorana parkeri]|uniref:Golgi membrane protein 1 n=1 Tax=Nanorana parkeri TaxID=125878 RepID=UPI000854C419|nr:PREDICTED: Golgi membrane protein 1 [Nanorana parkeri]